MRSRNHRLIFGAVLLVSLAGSRAAAGDHPPYSAAHGLDLARSAARSWSPDAELVYVENDEDVDASGLAVRWGYLFYSQRKDEARGYTIRDGEILEATELEFELQDPPPLAERWVDSDVALEAAEENSGRKYRQEWNGRLSTMLLVRGAFYHKKPDLSTWTLLYTSEDAPALWVVVSAENGKVLKTWRG
jgi:hypothetical protein